ncbi:MAG: fimbria/pilus periplasmic chaperone [Betaproteobacteria bacterium]|nr:fimbria/pilus periplasmic chaperone [Betaproteobacteria bacterium]
MLGAGLSNHALAGNFTITPVRIYMTPKDRATAVTVTNDGDAELVMQAELFLWKQGPDGKDELTPTDEVFLSPPIIKLAPKSRQVVRLARVGTARPTQQLTYRMIVREIPEARKPTQNVEVQVALAFNMPVFITPPEAKPKLDCTVARVAANAIKATCENSGNAHTHLVSLLLNGSNGDTLAKDEVGGYILSGIKRSFELKRKDGKIPGGAGLLVVSFADGSNRSYDFSIVE